MIFHHQQWDIINHIPKLELNGEHLVTVEDLNFLGLTIEQHMTWNAYILKVSNKISRSLGIMNRLKWYLPQNMLQTIYNSLILSHIIYSILVWGFKSNQISKLQKRAVHMLLPCSKYNADGCDPGTQFIDTDMYPSSVNKSAQGRWVVSTDIIRTEHILSIRSVTNGKSQSCWLVSLGWWGWV